MRQNVYRLLFLLDISFLNNVCSYCFPTLYLVDYVTDVVRMLFITDELFGRANCYKMDKLATADVLILEPEIRK